ncbi:MULTISPECIES: DUF1971 domain-containing protein [unclassified Cyanobium]|uniref:DUF1971 domain-containing protein n=1 Tax=unclassified Cyanobium TaxID=2627006 RepID=UPI0020CEF7B7|nr:MULTISPECIES: DUF1971 domain-containing protein [unclassified Cyanobium]MCP9835342.1 DUF1971 domain-containing protein [Cyanobium sp. La Preciosa 7G6]MCP9938140.1 DUF1971 domain-containing protein [Cyanobium sp. Aljojuca 7A6]
MQAELPGGLTPYQRTPSFDAETVPAGLRAQHSTKAGVWARVVVLEGSLPFRFLEPHEELVLLTPERLGIVAPTQLHQAEPGPGVRFYVEFHRAEVPLRSVPSPPPGVA